MAGRNARVRVEVDPVVEVGPQHLEDNGRAEAEPGITRIRVTIRDGRPQEIGNNDGQAEPGTTTKIGVTILDGIVSVNSLFTVAVFLGLTFNPAQQTIETHPDCKAGTSITKLLVLFEIVSFGCFLFSSIVAYGFKMAIAVRNAKDRGQSSHASINLCLLSFGMVFSGIGSFFGCGFLIASIVMVIQIRLGLLSCGGYTFGAIVGLCVAVFLGFVVYLGVIVYAIHAEVQARNQQGAENR